MGREFASAAMRWAHLSIDTARPEITGACDENPAAIDWFRQNVPGLKTATGDYRELLARDDIDAIYCAVPHHLHEQIYTDTIRAGKHLMGEKPFGIDREANARILETIEAHPDVFVRCSSQFPFFPAAQMLTEWIRENKFGRIIEVRAGFLHSSDMDTKKTINWKRQVCFNGEYGCMGDLGIHTQHIPFRFGWIPDSVYATLSNIVPQRPDRAGNMAACDTWDNATLMCTVPHDGYDFPMTLETKRISPGSTNEWFIRVTGMDSAAYFTTDDPNGFHFLQNTGKEQAWCRLNVGHRTLFPVITGSIFEFGFSDAILQMWAAFMTELEGKEARFGCFRPEETRLSHALQSAALRSHQNKTVEKV
jgi:predicted dehydrogenase